MPSQVKFDVITRKMGNVILKCNKNIEQPSKEMENILYDVKNRKYSAIILWKADKNSEQNNSADEYLATCYYESQLSISKDRILVLHEPKLMKENILNLLCCLAKSTPRGNCSIIHITCRNIKQNPSNELIDEEIRKFLSLLKTGARMILVFDNFPCIDLGWKYTKGEWISNPVFKRSIFQGSVLCFCGNATNLDLFSFFSRNMYTQDPKQNLKTLIYNLKKSNNVHVSCTKKINLKNTLYNFLNK